ncbi:MAG TPA: cation:proton antiporter [Verrucomicrobiae bacterium]|nr:cation:proton antiporter [Verrucomicrobiae bacterium]
MDPASHDLSRILIELGLIVVSLAILARIASRWGFSAIPLYLLAGLAFGKGGLAPLNVSAGFTHIGAEIGVLLLLFMLGLEYTGAELATNLRSALPAAVVDFALNFSPGFLAGLLLKWTPLAAILLGGVTYVSSSGVIAKVLAELRRLNNPETPAVLSILVLEDLAMAVYLPLIAVLLAGGGPARMALSVSLALAAVLLVLVLAVRYGVPLSRIAAHQSDEIVLLTIFGAILLVAGAAERLQVSAAIGAFLVGIAVSGPMAEQTHRLLAPLRDLFAATFFFFFGLQIDPATLPSALPLAILLGAVTATTKVLTGLWAARRTGVDRRGRLRAGMALIARGEFSIVIAGLGAGLEPQLGALSAAYVLFLAVLGPILARVVK